MSGTDFYQSVIQATWMNNTKKPMDDPRVRRAFHLVLDKPVLVDVVKDIAPMMVGGFIYPFSSFATPLPELSKRLGYQADPTASIKEAKALMKAAGHEKGIQGLDYLVREVASFKLLVAGHPGHAAADAERADQHPHRRGIRCGSTTWRTGKFDLAIGAIVSTLIDPSDYFNAWYKKGGPQNYSQWDNPKFNALLPGIDSEVDPKKRLELIRQAEMIMEEDPPLLPMSWEKINDGWYNYVKGHRPNDYFGIYDVVRPRYVLAGQVAQLTRHHRGMLTFYFAPGSSSMAVHIALHETGAPFEARPMSFATHDMRKPEFLAINPNGKVPTLLIDGRVLTEVAGILFYLARTYPRRQPAAGRRSRGRGAGRVVDVVHRLGHPSGAPGGPRAGARGLADRRHSGSAATTGRSAAATRSPTSTSSASTGASARRSRPSPATSPTSRPTTRA